MVDAKQGKVLHESNMKFTIVSCLFSFEFFSVMTYL